MINHKHALRFLTKDSVRLSIEEYLFLLTVRFENAGELTEDWKEIQAYVNLYYAQNEFYGTEFYLKNEAKFTNWHLMIDKLVRQGFLLDYRVDKKLLVFKEMEVTDAFLDQIWTSDKDKCWNDVLELLENKVGTKLKLPNGHTIDYLFINKDDFVTDLDKLKEFYWAEITKGGQKWYIDEFYAHLEWYLDKNGLQIKFVNFINNYCHGIFKKRIIDGMNNEEEYTSLYKRR